MLKNLLQTTSKKLIQKAAETTGDIIGNKMSNTNASPNSLQNYLEKITNEHDKENRIIYIYIYIYIYRRQTMESITKIMKLDLKLQ